MNDPSGRSRLDALETLFYLHQEAVARYDWACGEKCASCCTCNVVLTGLEARFLLDRLSRKRKEKVSEMIRARFPSKRYLPKVTTNGFARLCRTQEEGPEEENDPSWGACPLLDGDLCSVYEVRPFGCRALLSRTCCHRSGYAGVPPLVLTLNQVFLQVIEQLDQDGVSGNLSDMLGRMLSGRPAEPDGFFVRNEKIPCLMIPHEHRKELQPLLHRLSEVLTRLT